MQSVVFSWLLAAAQNPGVPFSPQQPLLIKAGCQINPLWPWGEGRDSFSKLWTPLAKGGFPTPFVAAQHLKRVFEAGIWPWEAGVKLSRSSLVPGHRRGEGKWAAKNLGEFSVQQGLWVFLSHALVANTTQHNPSVIPQGMGALEDAMGSSGRQRPICTADRPPEAQETCGPSRADLQTMSLGWWGENLPLCWGLNAPRNIRIEILYQVPACLSWRTWKSYESAECVSGWGGEHKNNHHCRGRQSIMAGLPAWKVNAIILCVCFSEG